MSDPSPVEARDEKVEGAPEVSYESGQGIDSIEQKLNGTSADPFPPRTLIIKRRAKRKDDGPLEIVCGFIVEHQIGLAVNLLVLLALTHMSFPKARRHTRKFFELSYFNSESGKYRAGWNDAWMVSFWIVVFTGLRASVMDYILTPLAKKGGVKSQRDLTRFSEQAWLLVYYSAFWPLGMYIYANSDYWLNPREMWTNWPNREITGLSKWYILAQYAFWLQQIMVINIEERRKDHWQMFTHHIVTTALIFTSYGYHQTKVANVILCLMDIVDIFLPVAKCLKYLGYTTICDVLFGVFMLTWVAARHVAYLMVCYSVWSDLPAVTNFGCYRGRNGAITGPFPSPDRIAHLFEPFRDPEGVVCFNNGIKWGFLSALLFLQGITIMWFAMIVKVALNVLRGGEADDVRSDDEGDADEEEEIHKKLIHAMEDQIDEFEEPQPIEEEVGIEEINLKGRTSNARYRKSANHASGVSLPGHSDRKELLGRIGCDKPV